MAQYIYLMGALAGIILFSMMMGGGRMLSQRQVFVNEASTQTMGVANEILDLIDRPGIEFDSGTAGLQAWEADLDGLTPPEEFGGCDAIEACDDVDDFDGLNVTITNQGMNYDVAIEVMYVSRSNPDSVVTTPTMSKRVSVTIEASSVLMGNDSPTATISRVITYR